MNYLIKLPILFFICLSTVGFGQYSPICDCLDVQLQFMRDASRLGWEEQAMRSLESTYGQQLDACNHYFMSIPEEQLGALQNDMYRCTAFNELVDLSIEMTQTIAAHQGYENPVGSVCYCVEVNVAMLREMKAKEWDSAASALIHERYQDKTYTCDRILQGEGYDDLFMFEMTIKGCSLYSEFETLTNERLEKTK